jgi:hypothetical protein
MKKIRNSKNRGNRKKLLAMFEFSTLQDAKKGLGMKKDKADDVYEQLMLNYNEQIDEIRKNKRRAKYQEKKENEQIKQNSVVITNPDYIKIKQAITQMKNKGSIILTLTEEGNVITSFEIDLKKSWNKIYHEDLQYKLYYVVSENLLNSNPNANIVLTKEVNNIKPQKIAQAFKQGITNCVFQPIIKFMENKINTAKTEGTKKKYISKVNVAQKMEEQYREAGVKEKDLSIIANKLQMDIVINQPFQKKPFIEARSNKKAMKKFSFINTRLNHVDLNEVVNNEPIFVSYEELQIMFNTLLEKNEFFTYRRDYSGISSIFTLTGNYKVKQDFQEFINNFEQESGLDACKLDDFKDIEISKFVRQGTHFNSTIDFVDGLVSNNEVCYNDEYKHIDQSKAYTKYKQCKYYNGFLGKITDFRKTNKIVDVGLYRIVNIKLSGKLKALNNKMKIYRDNNIYPSVELKFIKDCGGSFDIIEGCWGKRIDFDMDVDLGASDEWYKKDNGIRYYSKYVGCMYTYSDKKSFYMRGEEDFIRNMLSVVDYNTFKYFGGEEAQINYSKPYNTHLSHIASFITAYTRLNTLEQLMSMSIENLIRVCVDGIYYKGECKLFNNFRRKDEPIKSNGSSDSFISNYEVEYCTLCNNEYRPNYNKELHKGCGGSGKTTKNLKDEGFVKVCYFAPSWKLARNKEQELGVRCNVHYNLTCQDPEVYRKIQRSCNVLVIDEISMLDNRLKELIFDRFNMCKIIMCGDNGYQLDGFNSKGDSFVKFTETGFDNIVEHNHNYRVLCDKLRTHLEEIRRLIKENPRNVRQYALENFKNVDEITDYKVEDMILTRTHILKDMYTERYKHLDKYYVINTDRKYSKGEIIIGQKPDCDCVLQHAFTVHSIQGETADNNLYIEIEKMYDEKALYTAISRARRWEQIHLITR